MPPRGIFFGVSVELTEADIVAVKFFFTIISFNIAMVLIS